MKLQRASVIGVLIALLAACGSTSHQAASTARSLGNVASSSTSVPPVAPKLRVLANVSVPIDRSPLEVGFGAVWSASSHGLVRLSLDAARPTIVLPSFVDDIALSDCCVYALSSATNRLIEFDPKAMTIKRQWTLPAGAHSLAVGDHNVYVVFSGPPASVERIDLQSGATHHANIPHASGLSRYRAIAAAPGKVWVIAGGRLYRLDPATLSVLKATDLDAAGIWFGDGSLWAANENLGGGVERLDPTSDRVLARNDSDSIQIAFSPHAVWLSAGAGATAIDPVTAQVEAIEPIANVLSPASAGIAMVGKQLWMDYANKGQLQRILVSK
jgi:hypothetical protein